VIKTESPGGKKHRKTNFSLQSTKPANEKTQL
jgi:hypothetical protein